MLLDKRPPLKYIFNKVKQELIILKSSGVI